MEKYLIKIESMKFIIITKKVWNKENFKKKNNKIIILKNRFKKIKKINPKIIFFSLV